MFYVHEIHALRRSGRPTASRRSCASSGFRRSAAEPGTRLVWCVRSMPGTASYPELITMTAVEDGAALERLGARYRSGDLRSCRRSSDGTGAGVDHAGLASLEEFNPYSVELDELPLVRDGAPSEMYLHDFVAPQPGMQRVYEVQIREAFMKMLEIDALPMKTWGGFETVAGGGRVPLSLMVTWIADRAGDLEPHLRRATRGSRRSRARGWRRASSCATHGCPASSAASRGRPRADARASVLSARGTFVRTARPA